MADKFEREIDEILKKIDDFPRHAAHTRRPANRLARRVSGLQRSFAVRLSHVSVSQLMLTAMGVMVFSYLFRAAFGELWVYGMILGLILFFTAFALSFRSGGISGHSEPTFRGRPRSYYQRDAMPLLIRFRAWWLKQRRGRR